MYKQYINTIQMKTNQLESALESDSVYAQAKALTAVYDICKAAIQSLPDIVTISPDFFDSLKDLRPLQVQNNNVPAAPVEYLKEMTEQ